MSNTQVAQQRTIWGHRAGRIAAPRVHERKGRFLATRLGFGVIDINGTAVVLCESGRGRDALERQTGEGRHKQEPPVAVNLRLHWPAPVV